jgi:hypothetical protein
MDTDQLSSAFLAGTYTQADARRRINILEVLLEKSLYGQQEAMPLATVLTTADMKDTDRASLVNFINRVKLPKDHTALKKIITSLKDGVNTCPVATLTVSFEPSPEQITEYGEWFRKNVNPNVLLTFIYSAAVVGGCSVAWQGKQVTYDLEYLIKQKRAEIISVVNSYVEKKRKERII